MVREPRSTSRKEGRLQKENRHRWMNLNNQNSQQPASLAPSTSVGTTGQFFLKKKLQRTLRCVKEDWRRLLLELATNQMELWIGQGISILRVPVTRMVRVSCWYLSCFVESQIDSSKGGGGFNFSFCPFIWDCNSVTNPKTSTSGTIYTWLMASVYYVFTLPEEVLFVCIWCEHIMKLRPRTDSREILHGQISRRLVLGCACRSFAGMEILDTNSSVCGSLLSAIYNTLKCRDF
jgi:hypothetical protein